jgi:hypothetical protein
MLIFALSVSIWLLLLLVVCRLLRVQNKPLISQVVLLLAGGLTEHIFNQHKVSCCCCCDGGGGGRCWRCFTIQATHDSRYLEPLHFNNLCTLCTACSAWTLSGALLWVQPALLACAAFASVSNFAFGGWVTLHVPSASVLHSVLQHRQQQLHISSTRLCCQTGQTFSYSPCPASA